MAEEKDVVDTTTEEVDYVQAIQELKANSVPKEQYAKLKAENSKLLNSIINGESIEASQVPEKTDIDKLRKELFSGEVELNNLEYVSKALELRDAIIEAGGTDPFLPHGTKVIPDDNDIACANKTAAILKECVDFADGDSGIFTAELMRRTVDVAPKRK